MDAIDRLLSRLNAAAADHLYAGGPREAAVSLAIEWFGYRAAYAASISRPWAREWEGRIAAQVEMLRSGGITAAQCEAVLDEFGGQEDFVAQAASTAAAWCEQRFVPFYSGVEHGLDITLEDRYLSHSQVDGLERSLLQMVAGAGYTDSWWVGHPGGSWADSTFTWEGPEIWALIVGRPAREWVSRLREEVESAAADEFARLWQAELDSAFVQLRAHLEAQEAEADAARQARWPIGHRDEHDW
jgi:hypothetical protein